MQKGDIVYYYRSGQVTYQDATPAIVIDHSKCGQVATLKVYMNGTDQTVYDVKHDDHPGLVEHPHHRTEGGVWTERDDCVPPSQQQSRRRAAGKSGSKPAPVPAVAASKEAEIKKLADEGLTPGRIAARFDGVTTDDVKAVLS